MHRYTKVFMLLAILSLSASLAFAGPIYVRTAATGAGDGSSWDNAMASIQGALNLASSTGRPVWVAGGTYDPGATLTWPSNAKAFGGFAGTETQLLERDIAANGTIITGAGVRRVIEVAGVTNTRIDGFTIINGRRETSWEAGGGILCFQLDSSNIIVNCRIENCWARDHGGGIVLDQCSGVIVEHCVFHNNSVGTSQGGGLFIHFGHGVVRDSVFTSNASPNGIGGGLAIHGSTGSRVSRCHFSGNSGVHGGGISINDCGAASGPQINQCRFEGNNSVGGGNGGAIYVNASNPIIEDSIMTGNAATGHGGGAFVGRGAPRFQRCTFQNNSADHHGGGLAAHDWGAANETFVGGSHFEGNSSGSFGGGIDLHGGSVDATIRGTSFVANRGGLSTQHGGGGSVIAGARGLFDRCGFYSNEAVVGGGGAVWMAWGNAYAHFVNCSFYNNSAAWVGGGVAAWDTSVVDFNHCTFHLNAAQHGGAMRVQDGGASATVTNSIIWDNPAPDNWIMWNASLTISYSNIHTENQNYTNGGNNISADPQFTGGGNLRLQSGSPCRNAATTGMTQDIFINPRPFGAAPDMGAYEWSDNAPNVVSLTRRTGEPNPTNRRHVVFQLTLDKGMGGQAPDQLNGFNAGHFQLTGSLAGSASIVHIGGNATGRTIVVDTGAGSGSLGLNLTSSAGIACSGNLGFPVPFTGESFTIDKTNPQVAAIALADANPNNAMSVDFTVGFTELVTDVTDAAFDLITSGVAGASITGVSGAGATRTVTVNTGTGDGTIGIRLGNGAAIFDGVGNMLDNWLFNSPSYTIDKTAPTVLSVTRHSPTGQHTNAASIVWRVTFDEDVSGSVDVGDFTLVKENAADPITGFSVTGVAPVGAAGTTYDVICDTGTGDGRLRLDVLVPPADIRDQANNPLASDFTGGEVYAIDKTPPSVDISAPSPVITNSGPVTFTVTYADAGSGLNTITLAAGDVTVNAMGSAAAGGVAVAAGGAANQRIITLSDLTGDGTLAIEIGAGTATDNAGNSAQPAGPSTIVTVDNTSPETTLSADIAVSDPTDLSTIPMRVVFNENVSGFVLGDLVLVNASADGFTIVSSSEYTFDLLPAGQGLFSVTVPAGAASDGAGNANLASAPFERSFESDRPTVTLASVAPNPTNTSPIPVTATFSASVTGFEASDLSIVNAAVANFSGSGANYSFDLIPTDQGVVSAQVPADVAQDGLGAWNTESNTLARSYDTVSPGVELSTSAPNPTNAPIPVTATFDEPVYGFSVGDVTSSNATVTDFVGGDGDVIFTFTLVPDDPSGATTITASVAADVATDQAGNPNTASNMLSRDYDGIAPSVSSVVVEDGSTVLVAFDKAMGAGAENPLNYAVSGAGRGTLAEHPSDVQVESASAYRLVWTAPDEMHDGSDLTVTVSDVFDTIGNPIGAPNSGTGTAIGEPPTARCVAAITLELDANGLATLRPEDMDDGSDDNIGIVAWLLDGGAEVVFGCADIDTSPHTVTLRVEDAAGNADECDTQVTVEDNLPPVITIPGANPRYMTPGMVFTPPTVTALDNCDGVVPVTLLDDGGISMAPEELEEGEYTLLYEAEDSRGNRTEAALIVIVTDDSDPITVWSVGDTHFVRPVGGLVSFQVDASGGVGTLYYQWYRVFSDEKGFVPIDGADLPVYTITPITFDHAGMYVCQVWTMGEAPVQSEPFTLEVIDIPVPTTGLLGLALVVAITALAGATAAHKRR